MRLPQVALYLRLRRGHPSGAHWTAVHTWSSMLQLAYLYSQVQYVDKFGYPIAYVSISTAIYKTKFPISLTELSFMILSFFVKKYIVYIKRILFSFSRPRLKRGHHGALIMIVLSTTSVPSRSEYFGFLLQRRPWVQIWLTTSISRLKYLYWYNPLTANYRKLW